MPEPIIEPELAICDPHHHLWDFPNSRYLLPELLADLTSGHNVQSTVFVECGSFYRASGPEPMKYVGETEFVNGAAAMAASGWYGPVLAGGRLILVGGNSKMLSLNPLTGETLNTQTLSDVPAPFAPIVADGSVLVVTDDGKLTAWR